MLVGTVPEKRKKNMWKKKFPGADFEILKKKFSIRGVMVRGQFVFHKTALAL